MEFGLDDKLSPDIDVLETAFSHSTRKLIRLINVEWELIRNLKNDLDSKQDELRKAMEDMTRFKEMKIKSENYLKSAEKRLDNQKLLKVEQDRQVNKLKMEKEKIVKKCDKQEENIRQKNAFYEEKWRKRYAAAHSQNPRISRKAQKANEAIELNKKLRNLIEEEKKYEKELFRVKSKRYIFTEESKFYPFQNFVVNVAKIYLETRQIYADCDKISKEVADIERRIQSKPPVNDNTLSLKNSMNVAQNFKQNSSEEINNFMTNNEYPNVEMRENDEIEVELGKDINLKSNMNVEKDNSVKCIKSFPNNLFSRNNDANQSYLSNIENQANTSEVINNNYTTKAFKVLPAESKARKWMEKLKIFVPKFKAISEENNIMKDDRNSTKSVMPANTNIGAEMDLHSKNVNYAQYNAGTINAENLEKVASTYKIFSMKESIQPNMCQLVNKVTIDNITLEVGENSALKQESFQNTSKYFKKIDDKVESMDWDKQLTCEKSDVEKSVIQDYVTPNNSKNMNIEEKITEWKKDLNQMILTINEPMDIEEHSNARKFEASIETMKNPEIEKAVVKNVEMSNVLLQTNCEREITRSIERNESNIYSFASNDKKTITNFQSLNVDNSLPKTNPETESKSSLEHNERNSCFFTSKENKIVIKHQNTNANSSLLEINPEIESKSSLERNEESSYCFASNGMKTIKYQNTNMAGSSLETNPATKDKSSLKHNETSTHLSVLNEKEIIHQYWNENSGEIQRDVPVQRQIYDNKLHIAVNNETICNNAVDDTPKQHQLHHFLVTNVPQAPVVSKNDLGKDTEIITPMEINAREENIQHIQTNTRQMDSNISNRSPISVPVDEISHSPAKPSSKNSQSEFKMPTPSTSSQMDSNLKTPLTRQLQNSGEKHVGMDNSNFAAFEADSPSPGFAYTTRLMYTMNAENSNNNPAETIPKDRQNSIFAQMAFLNQVRSPDEEKSKFLTAFEDYLVDSPPEIKGNEKSMFAVSEDSPENEGKIDFFPLFASSNENVDKDTTNREGAFKFNFGGGSQAESPDTNKDFKFLF